MKSRLRVDIGTATLREFQDNCGFRVQSSLGQTSCSFRFRCKRCTTRIVMWSNTSVGKICLE